MRSKAYNTAGKKALIEYMAQNFERQFTVDELYAALSDAGTSVGKSSLYRLLERLVADGAVRKFKESELSSAVFQYIGSDEGCSRHLHLKCAECGKLVHLECPNSIELIAHIYEEHGFSIDSKKSVLYGKCKDCQTE
jgi:Fur family ferric uptake transcriptional regulator